MASIGLAELRQRRYRVWPLADHVPDKPAVTSDIVQVTRAGTESSTTEEARTVRSPLLDTVQRQKQGEPVGLTAGSIK